eukprot:5152442-Karenia_brevis.AAC.1
MLPRANSKLRFLALPAAGCAANSLCMTLRLSAAILVLAQLKAMPSGAGRFREVGVGCNTGVEQGKLADALAVRFLAH